MPGMSVLWIDKLEADMARFEDDDRLVSENEVNWVLRRQGERWGLAAAC